MERARLLSRSMLSERVSEGPIVAVAVVVGVVVDGGEMVQLGNDALEPALRSVCRHTTSGPFLTHSFALTLRTTIPRLIDAWLSIWIP